MFPSEQNPAAPAPRCSWAAILKSWSGLFSFLDSLFELFPKLCTLCLCDAEPEGAIFAFPIFYKIVREKEQVLRAAGIPLFIFSAFKDESFDAKPFKLISGLFLCVLANTSSWAALQPCCKPAAKQPQLSLQSQVGSCFFFPVCSSRHRMK